MQNKLQDGTDHGSFEDDFRMKQPHFQDSDMML